MNDLDLALRTAGRSVLIERESAQALVVRSYENAARREDRPRSAFGSLLAKIGMAKADEHERDTRPEASAQIDWAENAECADGYVVADGLAVIEVSGVLTPKGYYDWWEDCYVGGYQQIGAAIRAARADDRVGAILLRVDSPGGLVSGGFDLVAEIAGGNARAGGKPIWAHTTTMACSGAYAISAACDRILASGEAIVGSIGVVILHVDQSAMLTEWGLKVTAIESGAAKTMGASWKPLDDEALTRFQADVNDLARRFAAIVATGRGIDVAAIDAMRADAFLADHGDAALSGKALGLVDEIMPESAAAAALIASLSPANGAGASAAAGTSPSARPVKETGTMKFNAKTMSDLQAKAEGGDDDAKDKLEQIAAILGGDEEDDGEDGDGEGDDGEKDKEADAEGDENDAEAKAAKPAAAKSGVDAAMAVLKLPEAKGREQLAQSLAEDVGNGRMTMERAKQTLAAAPKGSRLGGHMTDRGLSPSDPGGGKPGAGLVGAVKRMTEAKKRA